jgi:hypothetical protein
MEVEITPLAQEFTVALDLDLDELIRRHLASGYIESRYCFIDHDEMLELVVSTFGEVVFVDLTL